MRREHMWRWGFFFVGLMVMSFGITLVIKGKALGTSPWDVLHIGLFKQFGLTIGSWSILTGLIIIVTTSLILRQWPKFATWLNMILIGSFIDVFNALLPNPETFLWTLISFVSGFFVLSIGCALYISANVGTGPRDTIMMILVEKLGFSVRNGRMAMEGCAFALGWLLGGPVGIGTIVLAFGTGYVIQPALAFFKKRLAARIEISEPLSH